MKNIIGIMLLVAGIVLLGLAYDSYYSRVSDVSRMLMGNSTDKTFWLAVGGAIGTILGCGGLLSDPRNV